jgi:processing peptidase subunit alpha
MISCVSKLFQCPIYGRYEESCGLLTRTKYAVAVLQSLLGGGSSFSQGGPGKGMYSRLQLNLLNRNHAIESSFASHMMYADSGLFGLSIAIRPESASRAASLLCQELHGVTGEMSGGIRKPEFDRSKNMLKSLLAMSVESRMVGVEGKSNDVAHVGRLTE